MARCPTCHRRLAPAGRLPDRRSASAGGRLRFQDRPAAPEVPGFTSLSLLGSGGFGSVWEATDAGGAPVAMKLSHAADREAGLRLEREAAVLARIGPPHVPALRGTGVAGRRPLLSGDGAPLGPHPRPRDGRLVGTALPGEAAGAGQRPAGERGGGAPGAGRARRSQARKRLSGWAGRRPGGRPADGLRAEPLARGGRRPRPDHRHPGRGHHRIHGARADLRARLSSPRPTSTRSACCSTSWRPCGCRSPAIGGSWSTPTSRSGRPVPRSSRSCPSRSRR